MTDAPPELHSDFFEEEEHRRAIRLMIDKMDLEQLVIMSAIAQVSMDEKNLEVKMMLDNPMRKFRKRRGRK